MAVLNYAKAKDILTKGVIDHPIRQGLSSQKAYDLLILEKSTIRDISAAYTTARTEIAQQLKANYEKYLKDIATMTAGQKEMMQIKFLRDAKLYENLETRIIQLGGQVDKITASAILEASGISNEYVKNELQALSFFTNLDPQNFARINTIQAELTVNHVNQGTRFVSVAQQAEILPQIQQQLRIGILKGESIDNITARIVSKTALTLEGIKQGVFSSIEQRARLNARWGIIESSSAAAVTQYGAFNQRCDEAGIKTQVKKQVIAAIDDRTTICCIDASGQIQDIDTPFDTEQGSFDYTPFHCNCRSTVAAWHALFEQFGKSTKQMQEESKKELQKRSAAKAKKKASRPQSKKTIANQKAQAKAAKQAASATAKTIPEAFQAPNAQITSDLKPMSTNEAQKILDMPTNAAREKAIVQSQQERSSMAKLAQEHVANVQKNVKIPKDLLAYDKEVLAKGTLKLSDAADLIRKADLPGDIDIIGGLARRGNTQHDLDLIIRAKNSTFVDIEQKLKPLYEEFQKRGISLDAYIEHSTGVTMGDPNTWVKGTEKYLDMLTKNNKDWAFRIPKDDIIMMARKIKQIEGQESLFAMFDQTPPVKPLPPPAKVTQVMVDNLYAEDAAKLADMKKAGQVTQKEYNAALKAAEDKVIDKAKMFDMEIRLPGSSGVGNTETGFIKMSQADDAIAKRNIIAKRLDKTYDSQDQLNLFKTFVKDDLKEVMEWSKTHRISLAEFEPSGGFHPSTSMPKSLKNLHNEKIVNYSKYRDANGMINSSKNLFDKFEYDDFVTWIGNRINYQTLDNLGELNCFEVAKYEKDVTRAFYNDRLKKIFVDTKDTAKEMIHEFGHFIQRKNSNIDSVLTQYFKERTSGFKLGRLYPNKAKNMEMSYLGAFKDDYMGKVYGTGADKREGSEMFSMCLQKMKEAPRTFAYKEPELFQMTLGIMMGLLG